MGKTYTNICALFAKAAVAEAKPEQLEQLSNEGLPHPTDTHPPTSARIAALGLTLAELRSEVYRFEGAFASQLLAQPEEIETDLTVRYYRKLRLKTGP